LCLFG